MTLLAIRAEFVQMYLRFGMAGDTAFGRLFVLLLLMTFGAVEAAMFACQWEIGPGVIELLKVGQRGLRTEMFGVAVAAVAGIFDFAMQRFMFFDRRLYVLMAVQTASLHPFAAPSWHMTRRALILQLRMRADTAKIDLRDISRPFVTSVQRAGTKQRLSAPGINDRHDQQRAGAE